MSVDMDVVGVTAAYLTVVRVCIAQSREAHKKNAEKISRTSAEKVT